MAVSERDGGYRLLWPEFGGLSIVVALPLVYLLVTIATPLLVEQLEPLYPDLFPEPFTTILTVVLWAGTAVVVLYFVSADVLLSIRRFEDRAELEAHVRAWTPERRWYAIAVGRFVVGSALVVVSGGEFVVAFERLIDMTVIVPDEFDPAFSATNLAWIGVFFVGFVLFAGGVDRLLVAGGREYLRRRHCDQD